MTRGTRSLLLGIVLLAGLALAGYALLRYLRPTTIPLALGERSSLAGQELVLAAPAELDSLSQRQVLALRQEAIARYPGMVADAYSPSLAVFGQIADGRPWWGTSGQFYYGRGTRSIDGPAEESRFLLNPYLLVAAEFDGLSIWADGAAMLDWDRGRISDADLAAPDFPLYCQPERLRWWPAERHAELTYAVSACIADINRWTRRPATVDDASFSLIAYNARDLGLEYLALASEDSAGLFPQSGPLEPVKLRQYVHLGTSCGYEGGCNNMSPSMPEIAGLRIRELPARAVFRLWQRQPASAETQPDLTWIMLFR